MREVASSIEDVRGVDITQIRRQLELPVAERVRSMVEAANVLIAIERRAGVSMRSRSE